MIRLDSQDKNEFIRPPMMTSYYNFLSHQTEEPIYEEDDIEQVLTEPSPYVQT